MKSRMITDLFVSLSWCWSVFFLPSLSYSRFRCRSLLPFWAFSSLSHFVALLSSLCFSRVAFFVYPLPFPHSLSLCLCSSLLFWLLGFKPRTPLYLTAISLETSSFTIFALSSVTSSWSEILLSICSEIWNLFFDLF